MNRSHLWDILPADGFTSLLEALVPNTASKSTFMVGMEAMGWRVLLSRPESNTHTKHGKMSHNTLGLLLCKIPMILFPHLLTTKLPWLFSGIWDYWIRIEKVAKQLTFKISLIFYWFSWIFFFFNLEGRINQSINHNCTNIKII